MVRAVPKSVTGDRTDWLTDWLTDWEWNNAVRPQTGGKRGAPTEICPNATFSSRIPTLTAWNRSWAFEVRGLSYSTDSVFCVLCSTAALNTVSFTADLQTLLQAVVRTRTDTWRPTLTAIQKRQCISSIRCCTCTNMTPSSKTPN